MSCSSYGYERTGAVALVTNAAQRIGRAIALDLAHHDLNVAIHYRASAAAAEATAGEARALGARAWAIAADLADEAACRALVPAVLAQAGRLDVVVNNASLFAYDDAASFGYAAMEAHWRANTAPAIVLAHALHEHLRSGGREGCVVNLLDQNGAHALAATQGCIAHGIPQAGGQGARGQGSVQGCLHRGQERGVVVCGLDCGHQGNDCSPTVIIPCSLR